MKITETQLAQWSEMGAKQVVFEGAKAVLKKHPNAIFLSADVGCRFSLDRLEEIAPGHYLDVGISEQTLIGMAAGLAAEGFLPFAVAYSPFVTARVLDQVRVACGAMNLKMVILGADAGLSAGDLGPALTALGDNGNMRTVPNLNVVEPADCGEIIKAMVGAADAEGPAFIRIVGGPNQPMLHEEDFSFTLGKARLEKAGTDGAFIAAGPILKECLEAAELLENQGLSFSVVNMHTIKPLDQEMLQELSTLPAVVTVEEHTSMGGLGSAVAEYYAPLRRRPRQLICSAGDRYYPSDVRRNNLIRAGLDAESLCAAVLRFLREEA
ncbi:MAG: transketolase [Clostridia bacterium]|nr:transketolase [Clostridia bacterium]